MEEEYLIEEVFLETDAPDTAEIEIEESGFANFIIQSENTNIEAEMIISGADGAEPTIQEYLQIVNYANNYPTYIDDDFLTNAEIEEMSNYIDYYSKEGED